MIRCLDPGSASGVALDHVGTTCRTHDNVGMQTAPDALVLGGSGCGDLLRVSVVRTIPMHKHTYSSSGALK